MTAKPTFRPATIADAAALAVLVDIAGEGMACYMWQALAVHGQAATEIGRERARREEGGFSYRNATVAEIDGEIAAGLVGYRLDEPYDLGGFDAMPDMVQPLLRLEAQAPGSWYVNVLACFPEFRGRGIGARLLEIADGKGRDEGAPAMSVIVGSWNEGAARLYGRAGYTPKATEAAILPPSLPRRGEWVLMTKKLR
ncbi:MAG: GNAT family N-acetyltransferase [Methyloceanibacter sp.]